jgi:hypothetical protein
LPGKHWQALKNASLRSKKYNENTFCFLTGIPLKGIPGLLFWADFIKNPLFPEMFTGYFKFEMSGYRQKKRGFTNPAFCAQ